jgi:hypothetical protein
LFHKIAEGGVVKNLTVNGAVTAAAANEWAVGGLTDENAGTIENVKSAAAVVNDNGVIAVIPKKGETKTGGGLIAGVNRPSGVILDCSTSGGSAKCLTGGGGIAGFNFGLIENCSTSANSPAGNQVNSGKSSASYSFMGGIAGFNWGTVRQSHVVGRVFGQSAYDIEGNGNEGKNAAYGGIAGYNGAGGVIEDSYYKRGSISGDTVGSIHGDLYVGGIAGINAGVIRYSYVTGAVIGGRDEIGGIAGKSEAGGVIYRCWVAATVAVKDTLGAAVGGANGKTQLHTYPIAPDGGTVTETFSCAPNATPTEGEIEVLNGGLSEGNEKFHSNGTLWWQEAPPPPDSIVAADFTVTISNGLTLPSEGTGTSITATAVDNGITFTLTVTIDPANVTDQSVRFETSQKGRMSFAGVELTAGSGNVEYYVGTAVNGVITCTVAVKNPVSSTGKSTIKIIVGEITKNYQFSVVKP